MNPLSFTAFVIKAIVNHPDDVEVTDSTDDMGILFTIKTHRDDAGLVIGRGGATIDMVRKLVRIIGIKNKQRISLKVLDVQQEGV